MKPEIFQLLCCHCKERVKTWKRLHPKSVKKVINRMPKVRAVKAPKEKEKEKEKEKKPEEPEKVKDERFPGVGHRLNDPPPFAAFTL